MFRILFVCQGNTCRSVMAEAIAKNRFKDVAEVFSVGISPQRPEDSDMAIETLQTYFDLDASGHVPKNIDSVQLDTFNYVIAMSPGIAKQLPDLPEGKLITWNIVDPWGNDSEAYLKSAKMINKEVSKLTAILKLYYS